MAKQTFSVGQVLTAAQMTSLQQTAMLGGSATAKTTSYTLVAADAGTVVSVNSTSATTITVNTGLFAAGDTVTIQNWGSGAVTITAGTATVNTAGSLIVPQYDGGVLYFTSASAAIYFDWVQAGATSPLTTKGDIWGYSTSDARIPVGANGTILTADSTEALGVKWAAAAGGSLTLSQIATGTLSGASVTFSSLSTYDTLVLRIANTTNNTANGQFICRINNNSGSNYQTTGWKVESLTNIQSQFGSQTSLYGVFDSYINNNSNNSFIFYFTNCKNAGFTYYHGTGAARGGSDYILASTYQGVYTVAEAVSSLVVSNTGGTFNAGSYTLWGG